MTDLFGTDGIRGIANEEPITPETGLRLGRAIIVFCRRHGKAAQVVIGRDTRISGEMLENAIVSGILSAGGAIYRAGEIPTPAVAYLARTLGMGAGIVISASHNSYEYNGFKVFSQGGYKLSGEEEAEIEELIRSEDHSEIKGGQGRVETVYDAMEQYTSFLLKGFPEGLNLQDMKMVLDCANGATFKVAPALFKRLGAKAETLFVNPDGTNINENCGSQYPETLSRKVLETGADVGLAFDGDGDRLIAVDEKGKRLTGDQLLTIYAKMFMESGELRGNIVVSTVMSNMGLRLALKEFGIEQVAAGVGDRYVMEEMRARKANLGGEESGHIIFRDYHSTGDGLLSALQLVRAIKTFGQPLSKLSGLMTLFPQTMVNVPVNKKTDISEVPALVKEIDRVESELKERGRVLVRFSGTEPVCRVMVEGDDREKIEAYAGQIANVVERELT